MTVGKTGVHPPDHASTVGFSFIAPCFTTIDERTIKDHIERNHFFWLDPTAPTEQDVEQFGELFGFHPLALEDTLQFGQRPKLDNYQDYAFLVVYGRREDATDGASPLHEVQMFSGKYLVTLHRDHLPSLRRAAGAATGPGPPQRAVPGGPRVRRVDRQLLPGARPD
jgi:Mg2+ and Co2+ transporter CorA